MLTEYDVIQWCSHVLAVYCRWLDAVAGCRLLIKLLGSLLSPDVALTERDTIAYSAVDSLCEKDSL